MAAAGLPVPRGFVVCAAAFQAFLDPYGGTALVLELMRGLDVHDAGALEAAAARLRDVITGNAPRALFYRAQKGALSDTRIAVVVQEMVHADRSGVLFTVDPIRHRRDCMVIEAVFGLGEGIVSGELTPDHYVVERDTSKTGRDPTDRRALVKGAFSRSQLRWEPP